MEKKIAKAFFFIFSIQDVIKYMDDAES